MGNGFFEALMNWLEVKNNNYIRNTTVFNVAIGSNGQFFSRNEIEFRFREALSTIWVDCPLDYVRFEGENSDLVHYSFRVFSPKFHNIRMLEEHAKNVAETVLLDFMRENNDYTPVDNLVAVKLNANKLEIWYARTPFGVDWVAEQNRPRFDS